MKRPRTSHTPKSNIAIEYNHSKTIAQIKMEKNNAEASLERIGEERKAAEANLEDVRCDLEDANDIPYSSSSILHNTFGRDAQPC
mmetsp:Transcript_18374/g.38559  ORF Transcript_18374/g.38559 Transcript_18374/m.38559 type:complete len:85 (-) Transcript_18374:129-383(-)